MDELEGWLQSLDHIARLLPCEREREDRDDDGEGVNGVNVAVFDMDEGFLKPVEPGGVVLHSPVCMGLALGWLVEREREAVACYGQDTICKEVESRGLLRDHPLPEIQRLLRIGPWSGQFR